MSRGAIIGFDVGTSSLKAAVADPETGKILEGRTWSYGAGSEVAPGVTPLRIYMEVFSAALQELHRDYHILAVGMTTQMYSVLRKTPDGDLVYQWNSLWDRRPDLEPEMADFLIDSGCRPDTLYPGYKLYTMDPEMRKEFLPYGLKEALIQYLTGNLATDYATASPFGLFDARKRVWNAEIIEKLGFDLADLPDAVTHDTPVGTITLDGMKDDRIVVAPGLGDGPSASLGCLEAGRLCGNLGTSMAVRTVTEHPDFSREGGLWNYAFDDTYYATGGISSNSCTVFHWMEKFSFDSRTDVQLYDPHEVRFFPWLHGERVPYWNSSLRGTFSGIQIGDGPKEFIGAAVRAVAFTYCGMVRTLDKLIDPQEPMILAGGGTNIRPLMEIIAGCTDHPIHLLENESYLGGTGSAISAARAAGIDLHPDLTITEIMEPTHRFRDELEQWIGEAEKTLKLYE